MSERRAQLQEREAEAGMTVGACWLWCVACCVAFWLAVFEAVVRGVA